MDNNDIKKSPIKSSIDNINAQKNIFITRIKILKQLKANGNDINIDTIQRVFNVNIIDTSSKKEKNTAKASKRNDKLNKKEKQNKKNINIKDKKEFVINLFNKLKLIPIAYIALILVVNSILSTGLFSINNSIEFNELNEQLTATIHRSIQSPQTEIYLKSKYDKESNSIVYFYEIIDNLDSYIYNIKNTSLNDELRIALLEKIAAKTTEIKELKSINLNEVSSISLVGHSYIVDNKYNIDEKNISGKDISLITASIKNNNLTKYNDDKHKFTISSNITLIIIEGCLAYFIYNNKNKHKKTQ